jgi:hypothetical protein
MEEQARRALTQAVGLDRDAAASRLVEIRRIIGRLEEPSTLADLCAHARLHAIPMSARVRLSI